MVGGKIFPSLYSKPSVASSFLKISTHNCGGKYSIKAQFSVLNAKWAVAEIDTDVFQQCGTIILLCFCENFAIFFASVNPPQRPTSGCATSILPLIIKSSKSNQIESSRKYCSANWNEYDFILVNDDLEVCYNDILEIIKNIKIGKKPRQDLNIVKKKVSELSK